MTTPGFSNMYSQNAGMTPSVPYSQHFDVRAPTSSDVVFSLGTFWIWPNNGLWTLNGLSTANAVLTADWLQLANASGDIIAVAGTANQVAVSTVAGTATVSLIGPYTPATYTAHGVLVGEGTSSITALSVGTDGQVLTGNSAADPSFAAIGTKSGLTAHGVLLAEGASAFTVTAVGATGQVLTGVTGADPVWTNLPAFNFVDVTGTSQSVAVNTTYIADNAGLVTFTLPTTATQGSTFSIVGNGAGGWTVAQNANQVIKLSSQTTTTGVNGSMSSTNRYNSAVFYATVGGASTTWVVRDFSGSFTFV